MWNSNYVKVWIANFMLFFAFYLLAPLLPLYLRDTFSAGKAMIGIVLSGYTLTALCVRPFSGFVVDSFSRKKVLLICYFCFALLFAGYFITGSLVLFAVIRTLHGGPFGATTVASSTMAVDVLHSERRSEGIGYYGLSNNIAMAIGPSAGLYIYHTIHNFNLLFTLSLVIAFIGLAIDSTIHCPADPQGEQDLARPFHPPQRMERGALRRSLRLLVRRHLDLHRHLQPGGPAHHLRIGNLLHAAGRRTDPLAAHGQQIPARG